MLPFWVVVGILFWVAPLSAQPEMLWSQSFGDQGFDLQWHQAFIRDVETEDLIFIREHPSEDGITRNYLTRVTPNGDLVWSHLIPGGGVSFNIPALIKTSQGLYAMVGGSPIIGVDCEFLLLIMNEAGDLVNLTMFENGPASHGNCLIETTDGGFALSGYFGSQMEIGLDWDFWLIRTNAQGQLLWSQTYGNPEANQVCQSILQTPDGGFLLAGTGDGDVLLKRVDLNGELFWSRSYGGPGTDECNVCLPNSDGGYILAGLTESEDGDYNGLAISITERGDPIWSQSFGGRLPDQFGGAVITSDGGVALFGSTQSAQDQNGDFWLMKLGPLGNPNWECTFGGDAREEGNAIIQMEDGRFALIGNTNSFDARFGDVWMVMTSPDPNVVTRYKIHLDEGWSFISSPVKPANPDMEEIWRGVGQLENVEMVKDQLGQFYIPGRGFNGIPEWDVCQGYLVYMLEADSMTITNAPLDPQTSIPIREGWNLVAYFPEIKLQAPDAFERMGAILDIVKDDQGRFYDRSANFSNMGLLKRGEAYNVKANLIGELVWNIPVLDQRVEPAELAEFGPVHFKVERLNWRNMSLLISCENIEFSNTIEIGVFTAGGLCVGAAAFQNVPGRIEHLVGLAVWGDDPETPTIEGATEGEELSFRTWDSVTERQIQLNWATGDAVYYTDAHHQAVLLESPIPPEEFLLNAPFPNPFNGSVTLRYSLPDAGSVKITVLDVYGKEVAMLVNSQRNAGEYQTQWTASMQPSGIYIIRMQANGKVQTVKAVLAR